MTPLDRLLQRWRIAKARPYVKPGARVLDVSCADGALFRALKNQIGQGVGIDSALGDDRQDGPYRLIAGKFPEDLPPLEPFDVITMLAVLEHFPPEALEAVAQACARLLKPDGVLVITVPAAIVDEILHGLKFLRLIEGDMGLEQHHHFDATQTPALFQGGGLHLVAAAKFQLGLNNLFVFQKPRA